MKVIPELGISYGNYRSDSFTTEVPANPSLARTYEAQDIDNTKGIVGVGFISRGGRGRYFGSVRYEWLMGGSNDIDVVNYYPGSPTAYSLHRDVGNSTFVLQVGGEWKVGSAGSIELGLRGDFNKSYSAYTVRAAYRYFF